MIRFLVCQPCARAWTAFVAAACDVCGGEAFDISPWGGARSIWYGTHIRQRAGKDYPPDLASTAYRSNRDHRASIYKGILARGNTATRLVA